MVNEEIVGTDINYEWTFNDTGDLELVKGSDNLSQAIYLRLTAYMDSLIWAYDFYGSYTKEWLGKNQSVYTQNTLIEEIKKRVKRDPRIADADISLADWTGHSIGIQIRAQVIDGTTFQEYFIFSDLPRTDDNFNSPQWSNTWIETRDEGYYATRGEYVTVHCYVRDKLNKLVPVGEVSISLGKYHIDMENNPQRIAESGTSDPGGCTFSFRIPPFIKNGTYSLIFKYKGIRGYNNCEGETNIYIVDKLPTYMEYVPHLTLQGTNIPPDIPLEITDRYLGKEYFSNDNDELNDPIVHVCDANDYDVLHGQVRYYLNDYLSDGTLIFLNFPIIFHNSILLQRTVYMYCNSNVLNFSEKLIFNVDNMFRPGNIFELVGQNGEHIDYLQCLYDYNEKAFYLVSTIATIPYETNNDGSRMNNDRNDDVDIARMSNCQIVMKVIE